MRRKRASPAKRRQFTAVGKLVRGDKVWAGYWMRRKQKFEQFWLCEYRGISCGEDRPTWDSLEILIDEEIYYESQIFTLPDIACEYTREGKLKYPLIAHFKELKDQGVILAHLSPRGRWNIYIPGTRIPVTLRLRPFVPMVC